MPPATIDDALKLIRRDPVAGYIAIAVIGAQPPNPTIVAPVNGRSIVLPDWSGLTWLWYGGIAEEVAHKVMAPDRLRSDRARKDVARAQEHFAAVGLRVMQLGAAHPDAALAGEFYAASVKLVIEAVAGAFGPTKADIVADAIKSGLVGAPAEVVGAIKKVIGRGADGLAFVARQANKVAKAAFGVGFGGLAAVALLALLAFRHATR